MSGRGLHRSDASLLARAAQEAAQWQRRLRAGLTRADRRRCPAEAPRRPAVEAFYDLIVYGVDPNRHIRGDD